MERHTGAENRAEDYLFGDYMAFGVDHQRSTDFFRAVFKGFAYLVGHYFAEALKVAAEAQGIALHVDVAHLGEILADKRRMFGKVDDFHYFGFWY